MLVVEKRGAAAPLGPSPKSAYDEYKIPPPPLTHSPQLNNNRGFKDPLVTSFLRILEENDLFCLKMLERRVRGSGGAIF